MEIRIRDTGPGIPPEALARLFEPFYSNKSHGMGMGLPISRTIIEAHQGTLEACESAVSGAEFRITLPADSPRPDELSGGSPDR